MAPSHELPASTPEVAALAAAASKESEAQSPRSATDTYTSSAATSRTRLRRAAFEAELGRISNEIAVAPAFAWAAFFFGLVLYVIGWSYFGFNKDSISGLGSF